MVQTHLSLTLGPEVPFGRVTLVPEWAQRLLLGSDGQLRDIGFVDKAVQLSLTFLEQCSPSP